MKKMKEEKRKMKKNLEVGGAEWYREKIFEIVRQLENIDYLGFIYNFMVAFKRKWGCRFNE